MFALSEDPRALAAHWCDAMPPGMSAIESVAHLVLGLMQPLRFALARDYIELFPECPGLRIPRRALNQRTRAMLDAMEAGEWRARSDGSAGSFAMLRRASCGDFVFSSFEDDERVRDAIDATVCIESLMRALCDNAGEHAFAASEVCRAALLLAVAEAPRPEPPQNVDALAAAFDRAVDDELAAPVRDFSHPPPPPGRTSGSRFLHPWAKNTAPPLEAPNRFLKSDQIEREIADARRAERAYQHALDVRLFVATLVDRMLSW